MQKNRRAPAIPEAERREAENLALNTIRSICEDIGVQYDRLRVHIVRGRRELIPILQVINPTGTAKQHWRVADRVDECGWPNRTLFGFSTPKQPDVVATQIGYPEEPTSRIPFRDEDEETIHYHNRYRCDDCDESWEDVWDSMCDSECPKCGRDFTPHQSIPTGA